MLSFRCALRGWPSDVHRWRRSDVNLRRRKRACPGRRRDVNLRWRGEMRLGRGRTALLECRRGGVQFRALWSRDMHRWRDRRYPGRRGMLCGGDRLVRDGRCDRGVHHWPLRLRWQRQSRTGLSGNARMRFGRRAFQRRHGRWPGENRRLRRASRSQTGRGEPRSGCFPPRLGDGRQGRRMSNRRRPRLDLAPAPQRRKPGMRLHGCCGDRHRRRLPPPGPASGGRCGAANAPVN